MNFLMNLNHKSRLFTVLVASLAILATACSSTPPRPDTVPETQAPETAESTLPPLEFAEGEPVVKNLEALDDTRSYRVGNLHIIHKKTPANAVVSAQLYIIGGATNLTEETAGIEQLALNVATSGGTLSTPKDAFNEQLDSVGSSISSFVDRDYSGYALHSVVDHFDLTWDLFVQTVFEPAMPEAEIELRRQRQLADIQSLFESPDSQVSYVATRLLFQGHPYYNMQLGTAENVESFTRDQLLRYQRSLVTPERMLLVVVGNVPQDDIIDKVKASFGKLAPSQLPPNPGPAPLEADAVAIQVETRALPTNYIYGLFPAPSMSNDDYAPMLVAIRYLRDRLFEEIRTKRNLTYAVSAGLGNKRANYGLLYVTAVDPAATMPVMLSEVDRLKTTPLTEQDLEEVRNVFLTSHYMNLQTNSSQASMLGEAQIIGGDWRITEQFPERVRAVQPDDIQRVAQKYFQNYQFGIVGNPDDVPPDLFGATP